MKIFLQSLTITILLVAQISYSAQNSFAQDTAARQAVSQSNDSAARLAAIEKAVEEKQKAYGIPGISLTIVEGDKVILSKGFGTRNRELNLPVTPDTLFGIGSSTKAFTAMATMISADEGKLSLDDSPKKFLPYFKLQDENADAKVTLRDLLSHRTGLDRTDLAFQFPEKLTREDVIKIAGLAKPTARFRERWQYQNTMFIAAGEAAAKANNTTWEKLVETKIFKPLGMTATNTSVSEMQKTKNFSCGYDFNPETKEIRKVMTTDQTSSAPAGAINSNSKDMAQWLKLMLGGGEFEGKRLVSEKNFKELITEQMPIAPKLGYGFGWFLRDWRGKKEVDHGGNVEGFSTMIAMIPEERLGFIMLSNVTYSPLQDEIREIVFSNLLSEGKPETQAAISSENNLRETVAASPALREIVGEYESERSGKSISIKAQDNAVYFQPEGQQSLRLIEKDKNNFAVEGLPEGFGLSAKRDESGKVSGLIFNQQGIIANLRPVVPVAVNIEDLMKKEIEALGGEANLRKHTSIQIEAAVALEGEGMTGETVSYAKAPNLSAANTKYFALGKQVGESFDFFDGKSGGSFTMSGKQFIGTPFSKSGKFLEDARAASAFYAPLDWNALYQKVTVKKLSRIGDEEVYVVEKIPANGNPVIEYVSTKSFLILRRESVQPIGYFGMATPFIENFSDYRLIDRVMMPYKITSGIPHAGVTVTNVKAIKFNVEIQDSVFHPAAINSMKEIPKDQTTKPQISAANPADVATIDSIIAALYDVISGAAGTKRDWNRLRSLFVPEGKMIPIAPKRDGGFAPVILTVDGYIERSGNYVETNGFFESEISRKTERFGNLAHVFSTYEGKHKQADEKPFLRGINSIQLMNDGTRWWIINLAWESERPGNLLPEKYLNSQKSDR